MKISVATTLALALFLFICPQFSSAQGPEIIKLPTPQTEGGKPLMQALKARQSTRGGFGPMEKLSLQTISNLLWAADGVNRPPNHRTAPSAVDWQNVHIYLTTPDGLFLYLPEAHQLQVISKKDVRGIAGMQDFVPTAPLNLIYIADMSKTKTMKWQGEDVGVPWTFAGVGTIAQNVYLFCASEGLACILRAMVDPKAVAAEIKLGPDDKLILAQTIAQFKK
jgi:hypothetical protein